MSRKIVVIGANAAGAKAAAKAKRIDATAEVILVDRGDFISYGACGIPYFLEGLLTDPDELMKTSAGVLRDASFFRAVKDVRVLTRTEAVSIDRERKELLLREEGRESVQPYDTLILATGTRVRMPPLENIMLRNILTLKSLEDGIRANQAICSGRKACVVGAGLIGIEAAEALTMRGMDVTVLEMRDQILPGVIDPDLALLVANHLKAKGVTVVTGAAVRGFRGSDRVEAVVTEAGDLPAELVIIAPGVQPDVRLASDAGLKIGAAGGIAVDDRLRTSDRDIYACGDCCESVHLISGRKVVLPLGSTANKMGRVAGINAAGGDAPFAGVVGTAIVKVFDLAVARTGLSADEAKSSGFDVETVLAPAPDRAHFYPGAKPIILKLVANRRSGRIVGVQGIGEGAVDKRIDVAATAITFGVTAEQLSQMDLAYAPPYSSAMDPLVTAADIMKNKLSGEAVAISPLEVKRKIDAGEDFLLVDVRTPAEHQQRSIPEARLIPLGTLRAKLEDLPRDKEIVTLCKISLRGYEAQKILQAAGFTEVKFMDGGLAAWPY